MNKNYSLVTVIRIHNQSDLQIEKQKATPLKLSRLTFTKTVYKGPTLQ
jgi:hypothetical protein